MSTPVHALETPLNTCRASRANRARRDERVALCCPTSATQQVTTFSWIACRDVTQQMEFGLIGSFRAYDNERLSK